MRIATGRDTFIIEADERDQGGGLRELAAFESFDAAKAAWDKMEPEAGTQLWLCRLREGINDPAHCDALLFKDGDEP